MLAFPKTSAFVRQGLEAERLWRRKPDCVWFAIVSFGPKRARSRKALATFPVRGKHRLDVFESEKGSKPKGSGD